MNDDIHLERRASSSRGKHEGESSLGLCDRLDRTRDNSQRQLPTDHDYAVSTREYQTDQSSLKTAPAAARSVFGKKQTQRSRRLTRSLHIRPMRSPRSHRFVFRVDCRYSEKILPNDDPKSASKFLENGISVSSAPHRFLNRPL